MTRLVETSREVALRRDPKEPFRPPYDERGNPWPVPLPGELGYVEHSKPTADEPMPVVNSFPAIQDLVIEDILERKREGTLKYGTPLQPFNGRSALRDLYQELLDATQYVRQLIYEEEST